MSSKLNFCKAIEIAFLPHFQDIEQKYQNLREFNHEFLYSTSPQPLFMILISHEFSRPNSHIEELERT